MGTGFFFFEGGQNAWIKLLVVVVVVDQPHYSGLSPSTGRLLGLGVLISCKRGLDSPTKNWRHPIWQVIFFTRTLRQKMMVWKMMFFFFFVQLGWQPFFLFGGGNLYTSRV